MAIAGRSFKPWIRRAVLLAAVAAPCLAPAASRAAVLTYGGSPLRAGTYPIMHRLSPPLLRDHRFGRLFDRALPDGGQVYAQPLLADGRLVVVTEKNDVYELNPKTGRILRSRFLTAPWQPILATADGSYTCHDLYPDIGVTSTPVIDTATGGGVIYLTAKTPLPPGPGSFNPAEYLMYALRLSNLSNVAGFNRGQPLVLNGFTAGNAPSVDFNATFQLQRPALLQLGGEIYAGFGSHCDTSPYRGWVVGVRAANGMLSGTWATPTAPGARGGAVWMSGGGLMSDGPGRLFLATGTGFNAPGYNAQHTPTSPAPGNKPPSGLADSVVRLKVARGGSLSVADFFTPCNVRTLDGNIDLDRDLGSGGVVALPNVFDGPVHRPLLLAGGKGGTLYLLDRDALGGFAQGPNRSGCPLGGDRAAARIQEGGEIWGDAAVWPGGGGWVYLPTESTRPGNDPTVGRLEFYRAHRGSLQQAGETGLIWGKGSGSPIVTSIGSDSTSAMVWAVSKGVGAPRLRVYAAAIQRGAHAPTQLASFPIGPFAKFAEPGVGPDEIFVGGAGHVVGFGIRR